MPSSPVIPAPLWHPYDLVVIGSSAGGIDALTTLVGDLPADFAAPLVIAYHLDPDHVSHLGEILASHTALPVQSVADHTPLLDGMIYVDPPDRDVEIGDHDVDLQPHDPSRSTPSINRLFSSAAQHVGDHLIGVVLTGAGSDGAAGARDVKAAGGTVIMEDLATAAYASMPQSLAPSTVDLVVDLPHLGALLGDLVAGAFTPTPPDHQPKWVEERQQLRADIVRLTAQRDQLHTLNQTLRVANDQLNATLTERNEDLVVRTEHVHAASEEITTLNEELQATKADVVVRTGEVEQLAAVREEQRQVSAATTRELAAILRCLDDAVLVVNPDGTIRCTNAAYTTLFGERGLDQVVADEDGHPLPPAAMPQQRVLWGSPFIMRFTRATVSGEPRWFEATGEPLHHEGVMMGGVLTVRDITDRRLRRLQEDFLALASHELRSPLSVMLMAAQLLERRLGTAEEATRSLLTTIMQQGQRLQQLSADLTDVTRLQSGKVHLHLAPVDLQAMIAQTVTACKVTMPQPPVRVEAPTPLLIHGDAVRVEQILTNLLTNASKYAATSPQIVVTAHQVGGEAVIQVQDSGPGIDAATLPHLFQRYYQARPDAATAHSGLGLGLFITHDLVVAQGGTIQVTSQVGQGTTFTLRFPLLPADGT